MVLAVVGDVHGRFRLMMEEIDYISKINNVNIDAILQVGDFGAYTDRKNMDKAMIKHNTFGEFLDYASGNKIFPIPIYFIKGNHEEYDFLEKLSRNKVSVENLHYLENGTIHNIEGWNIGIIGGNYSPARYGLDRKHPRLYGGRRKHFNYQDINDLILTSETTSIDIILAHDAPKAIGITNRMGVISGCDELTSLINFIQPKYYFHGHYHYYMESELGSTKVISLSQIGGKGTAVYLLEKKSKSSPELPPWNA